MRTPLTRDQVNDLQSCMYEWERIRRANGYDKPFAMVDIVKSCLLGRMTIEGKPPLPDPPPTAYSAPWYSLIEKNGADLSAEFNVGGPFEHTIYDPQRVIGICGTIWKILEDLPNGYVVTHDRAPGEWILRHRNEGDAKVRGGTTQLPGGDYGPFYLDEKDWILIGPERE